MNGLDLFSGIGGLAIALADYVRPIAYCECDRYAQAVLLSRMRDGCISNAGVWDDVRTLNAQELPSRIDIIYGGFPCQDISIAGPGAGLAGERSGLFFEIVRLTRDIRPRFVFLENVPAITTRGLERVCLEFTQLGYDSRWTTLSAASVGACHLRNRWWFLAHTKSKRFGEEGRLRHEQSKERAARSSEEVSDPESLGSHEGTWRRCQPKAEPIHPFARDWWTTEPNVGRVAHGISHRVDRIRGLGNAVVPLQAKTAFEKLLGRMAKENNGG